MKFAKIVFFIAGAAGLLLIVPQFFLEEQNGRDFPPPITNPENYYGFPGMSLVVGAGLLAAIGDINRFPSGKKLAAYFGVFPSTKQSGDTSRNGRITKQGRSEARWLLVEAAEHLRKANGPLHALYKRIHRQRGHNVAVVAVARKLAELVWHLLTKEEDFIYTVPRSAIDKRSNWRKLAKRKVGVEVKSAAKRAEGRPVLYGTGVSGKRFKTKIVREAAQRAERIYEVILKQRADSEDGIRSGDHVFDPTRPVHADRARVHSKVTEQILEKRKVPKT